MASAVLSAGKRKKVASRVFGDSVDLESSLCYTPSPGNSSAMKSKSRVNMAAATIPRIDEAENEDESNTPQPVVLFSPLKNVSSKAEKRVSFAPEEKENSRNVNDSINTSLVDDKSTNTRRLSSSKVAATLLSVRDAELNRLRATARSPLRQALAKKTTDVVNAATSNIQRSVNAQDGSAKTTVTKNSTNATFSSVNQSLNAIRKAKKDVARNKTKTVKTVRFQWEQENSEAKTLQQTVEENRRQIRTIQRQLSSAHFKQKARKDEAQKMERFAKLEQEYIFKSEVFRDHQMTLKAEREQGRRKSTDARAKVRRNQREGEEKMKQRKMEEDQAIFDVRIDLHRARMEAARTNAAQRRKSFQFRAGDARRIRGMRASWKEKELQQQFKSFELSRAAARDVDNYKKKVAKELREDIRATNVDARKSRQREEEQAYDAMIAEHASYELKWAGERDAEDYRKRMREERRKSIAGRNKESVRHANVMEEIRSIAREKEAESYMLKFAGERDAKAYLVKLAEERRKSLQMRAKDAKKAREWEEEQHAKAVQEAIADGLLQSDCQKDVEKYIAECEERRRKSLQFGGKETHMNRLKSEEQRLKQLQQEEASHKLESLAQKDVEEYYKDCQRHRRKSLALRAKERRQLAAWKKKKAQEDVNARAHTSYLKSLDVQHMASAEEQERARKAMDALRTAGYNIKGNPFGDLLSGL